MSRISRFITFLFAALQIAAPAMASVAEGAFSKQVRDPQSHIESVGQSSCVAPHAADCGVCRYLSGNSGVVPAAPALVEERECVPVAETIELRLGSVTRGGFDSRAPPAI